MAFLVGLFLEEISVCIRYFHKKDGFYSRLGLSEPFFRLFVVRALDKALGKMFSDLRKANMVEVLLLKGLIR